MWHLKLYILKKQYPVVYHYFVTSWSSVTITTGENQFIIKNRLFTLTAWHLTYTPISKEYRYILKVKQDFEFQVI